MLRKLEHGGSDGDKTAEAFPARRTLLSSSTPMLGLIKGPTSSATRPGRRLEILAGCKLLFFSAMTAEEPNEKNL
ncbi:hypothetical protein PVAP13_3NG304506 [Panicum virgatum]|uniref:Uncharacterized protein n=1 Tax=Panicum virgatum TaxID=38727 RepID=A0A8T0UI78_PANVG|nr:hypothetical protein PVAP13_3NG304506 [Panicum virgatum]